MSQYDYYSVLGVSEYADKNEIRTAYRQMAFQYHPDRNADNHEAAEKMKILNEAYAVLSDDTKKKEYDSMRMQYGDTAYTHFKNSYSEHDIFSGSDINRIFEELARDFGFRGFDELFREFYGTGYRSFSFNKNGFSAKGFVFRGPGFFSRKKTNQVGKTDNSFPGPIEFIRSVAGKISQFTQPSTGNDITDSITISEELASKGGPYAYFDKTNNTKLIVRIPAGIKENQKIRLAGQGRQVNNGEKQGDLYLKVNIKRSLVSALAGVLKKTVASVKSTPFGNKQD